MFFFGVYENKTHQQIKKTQPFQAINRPQKRTFAEEMNNINMENKEKVTCIFLFFSIDTLLPCTKCQYFNI